MLTTHVCEELKTKFPCDRCYPKGEIKTDCEICHGEGISWSNALADALSRCEVGNQRCRNCTNWTRDCESVIGTCKQIVYGPCPMMARAINHHVVQYHQYMFDRIGDTSKVETGEDFGCVHFSPRYAQEKAGSVTDIVRVYCPSCDRWTSTGIDAAAGPGASLVEFDCEHCEHHLVVRWGVTVQDTTAKKRATIQLLRKGW